MTSEVDICNLALLRLGTRSTISSLTEGSTESNACAHVYAMLRDLLLSSHPWTFASQRVVLADLGSPPIGWRHRYAYPANCLKAKKIHGSGRSSDHIPFTISGDADQQGNPFKVILCDFPKAELIFTARIVTPDLFPAHFIEALSWMIAAELANALCCDLALSQYAVQMASQSVAASRAYDANEGLAIKDPLPDWIAARGHVRAEWK